MSEWKTFSGKSVDEAMEEAGRHLGAPREKLEVEILSGGSSGIFGLVGKKKAQVRARVREDVTLLGDIPGGRDRRESSAALRGSPSPSVANRPSSPGPSSPRAANRTSSPRPANRPRATNRPREENRLSAENRPSEENRPSQKPRPGRLRLRLLRPNR